MKIAKKYILFLIFLVALFSCEKEKEVKEYGTLQLTRVLAGTQTLSANDTCLQIPVISTFEIQFSSVLDTALARHSISLRRLDSISNCEIQISFSNDNKSILVSPKLGLSYLSLYNLSISAGLKGLKKETFAGEDFSFVTENGLLKIEAISINGLPFQHNSLVKDVDFSALDIEIQFNSELDTSGFQSFFSLFPNPGLQLVLSGNNKIITITNISELDYYKRYSFQISSNLVSSRGFRFAGYNNSFITSLDSSYKMPLISDEELLTLVQRQTFKYFYDFAHPSCGLTRERNTSGDVVTIGGSGFGVMAMIVGIERGFISRQQGLDRLSQILTFLETCDRFHGAWPHWLNGSTGQTVPFSPEDNGGDLVETSFMAQGLITMRQYLDSTVNEERNLISRINTLCESVEYDWFTQGQNVLYWHWSPTNGWAVNVKLEGYNETLITYVMAAASQNHTIPVEAYTQGYTRNGSILNGNSFYGYVLPLGQDYGGPLFFTHYSFLGLDPRNLQDQFANYWQQNVNQSLINMSYCNANPRNFVSYSADCWGLTASDNHEGYSAHSPTNDLGVITPTAALSSFPYCPEQSMRALKHFYYRLGDRLWGEYGFYDAFNVSRNWWASSYLAIDQGPIVVMIENHRSALCWDLFMSAPEIQRALQKLEFSY